MADEKHLSTWTMFNCLTVSIFRNGKSSCKHHLFLWAIYTIAMLNNQRVNRSLAIDHEFCSRKNVPILVNSVSILIHIHQDSFQVTLPFYLLNFQMVQLIPKISGSNNIF